MKHIKKFNEGFLDKLEAAVKGKSDKGKLIGDMLKKQNIPEEGFTYTFRYMGGADLTEEEKSHPISYLVNYKPNAGKLKVENGKLVLTDETLNDKKVVNILPMIDKAEKDGVEEHGRIWSSAVIKVNYKFDLSKEVPTLTLYGALLFDIEKGTWVKSDKLNGDMATEQGRTEPLDGDVDELANELFGNIWNQELVITYKAFIDECNKRKDIIDVISKHHKEEPVKEGLIKNFNRFKIK